MTSTEKKYTKNIGKFYYNYLKDVCYVKGLIWKKSTWTNRKSWHYVIYNHSKNKELSAQCYGFYIRFLQGEELEKIKLELL